MSDPTEAAPVVCPSCGLWTMTCVMVDGVCLNCHANGQKITAGGSEKAAEGQEGVVPPKLLPACPAPWTCVVCGVMKPSDHFMLLLQPRITPVGPVSLLCMECARLYDSVNKGTEEIKEEVNHPAHYQAPDDPEGHYEAIKIIRAWRLSFSLGNAVKYILRSGAKGQRVKDLQKALWYIQEELDHLTKRVDHAE